MGRSLTVVAIAAAAFAAGLAVGAAIDAAGTSRPRETRSDAAGAELLRDGAAGMPRPPGKRSDAVGTPRPQDRPDEAAVEVIYAEDSGAPSPEVTEAHRSRREKRATAREARAERRRDFLSSINLDLLTDDQRKLHAEYAEAVSLRDATRKDIRALRSEGKAVPDELQRRLSDAESVVRADAEDIRRAYREAAARAHGLDEKAVRGLLSDLDSVEAALGRIPSHTAR